MKKIMITFLCLIIICFSNSCKAELNNKLSQTSTLNTTTVQIVSKKPVQTDWYEDAPENGISYSAEYNLEFNSIESLKATMLKIKSYEDVLKFGGYGEWSKKQIDKYHVYGTTEEESAMITKDKFFLVATVKNQKFKKAEFHGRSLDYYYGDNIHIIISTDKNASKGCLNYDPERLNIKFTDNEGRKVFNESRRDFYCLEQYNYAILICPVEGDFTLNEVKNIANNLVIEKIDIK